MTAPTRERLVRIGPDTWKLAEWAKPLCVFCPAELADGDPIACVEHRRRLDRRGAEVCATTMSDAEYAALEERAYAAQPTACPTCGAAPTPTFAADDEWDCPNGHVWKEGQR